MNNVVYFSNSTDPIYNLALEEALFSFAKERNTLFLRQSALNVSLGANQNARKACNVSLLEREGGRLVRRPYGGGAMYGDEGALAFTFITPRDMCDAQKQEETLLHALSALGVETHSSGGLLYAGRDNACLSARATRVEGATAMHQGLFYVNADLGRLARYIAPCAQKGLRPDTFINLSDCGQELHMEKVKRALIEAFIRQFGPARIGRLVEPEREAIARQYRHLCSPDWLLLHEPTFELTLEHSFPFGNMELQFHVCQARVVDISAYSDAMDTDFVSAIAPALKGAGFRAAELAQRLNGTQHAQCIEIAQWLNTMGF